jgi:thiol-disulfide isomerase/thioredoxin
MTPSKALGFSTMRRITKIIFILPLLLAALCAQASAQQSVAASDATKNEGFRLKGIDGKLYDSSEMRGQVLVVSFGSTSCVPCIWESVAVEELKVEYAGKPVRFLSVNIEDTKQVPNEVLRYYAKERHVTVPVLRDPGGVALARYATGERIPVLVIFDTEGRLSVPVHHGMQQDITLYKQMVRERVNALLAARAGKQDAPAASK